jgi:hypothetical protein
MFKFIKKLILGTINRYWEAIKYTFLVGWATLVQAFVMMSVVYALYWYLQWIGVWPTFMPVGEAYPLGSLTELVALALTIGIMEEIAFRYFLMDCILMRWIKMPFIWAMVISAVGFGLAHFSNAVPGYAIVTLPQVVGAGAAGLWFAYLYKRFGLHLAILTHAAYDGGLFALTFYKIEKANEILALAMLLGGIFFTLLILYTRYKKKYIEDMSKRGW